MKALFIALSLLSATSAQSSLTIPSKASTEAGTSSSYNMFYFSYSGNNASRFQAVYDVSEVGTSARKCTQLEFRPASVAAFSSGSGSLNPAGTVQIDIDMSMSPVAHNQVQTTFASNHGANPVRVFSGAVAVRAMYPAAWPMPWQPPIVFQTPFTYDPAKGQSLVVEVTMRSNSSNSIWRMEQYAVTGGRIDYHHKQTGCVHSGGRSLQPFSTSGRDLLPGGRLRLLFSGYPNHQSLVANALLIGVQGIGSQYGGTTLPANLQSLGVPAYAGCTLAVAPITSFPMTFFGSTSGANASWLHLPSGVPLPNDPTLVGKTFYAQNLAVDQAPAGQAQIVASPAVSITVGDPTPPKASQVYSAGTSTSTTGRIYQGKAIALRLK